ncbi:hypothetical protein OG777_30660 [Micromonospora peucetia]|uniref:Uncharacterized protein n=1 Tax=Micromonospora peucetia TaxID=47871 RepID=A0A1C6W332_9ACTN|nr:hypothetical protein [Micromonospora peucetia]MCX4391268.1 hypothetical protein [Micromonospora peucetia]SCL72922.1 hypothetical protein GA0070608_5251 [Micromonospora peucetia]
MKQQPLTLAEILAVLDDPWSVLDLQRYFLGAGGAAFAGQGPGKVVMVSDL